MVMKKYAVYFLGFFSILAGCNSVQHISKTEVSYTVVSAEIHPEEDATVDSIITPYKIQLDKVMNEVLAKLPEDLTKNKPESTLGNWVSDVIVEKLKSKGIHVDFAVVNYGGLRVPYLTAGPLTRGEIFELSPFDNTIMIVDIPGHKLDSFFLLLAETGGWPISKEARLVITDKQVVSATLSGKEIEPAKIYKMATLDYVANGGDNMKVLIPLLRKETGIIFRDLLIDYLLEASKAGKDIHPELDGRIKEQ